MRERLLIDCSSVVAACCHACKKDGENSYTAIFNDKEEIIPSHLDAYEYVLMGFKSVLRDLNFVPSQCVLVKDGINSRDFRRQFLKTYKDREPRPPQFLEELQKTVNMFEETLLSYGGISVQKPGIEADDIIAALAEVTDATIWSKDKDLLACKGSWYWSGELNPTDKFLGISKDRIVVYKALVGDPSDGLKGASGFGEAALRDLIVKYGDDTLDELREMMENRTLRQLRGYITDFKPFQKIIDNEDMVYACYQCAKFHHPGWTGLDWQARFQNPNGDLGKWGKVEKLITKKEFSAPGFLDELIRDLHEGPVNVRGFDIETFQDEAGLAWGLLNASKTSGPKLDTINCHMAGFSLTLGENNEKCYYFSVGHKDTDNISIEDMTLVLDMLPDDVGLFVHNAGYELPVVRNHCELRFDRGWLPNVRCSMIMKNYVNENTSQGLKFCTKEYLKYKQVSYEQVVGVPTGKKDKNGKDILHLRQMNELTGSEVLSYGADDSISTVSLGNLFDLIMRYEGTMNAFEQCELATAYLFAEAHFNGIKFDLKRLEELRAESNKDYDTLYKKVQDYLLNLTWLTGDFDEGVIFEHRWPGCEFVPAESLSSSELKRVFNEVTGVPLKSSLRTTAKLGQLMRDNGEAILGDFVTAGDLAGFNSAAALRFIPNPEINLGSPTQLGKLFYEALKLPVRKYGPVSDKMREEGRKKGNPSTDEDAIKMALAYDLVDKPEETELLKTILKAKGKRTEESLYFEPYPKMPHPSTGLIHYNPGQSRATTRRHTPAGPNITQVSKKSPIREVYVPVAPNHVWLSLDLAGQELRLTAERSGCSAMRACYPIGEPYKDIHCLTGVKVAKIVYGLDTTYEEMVSNKGTGLYKKSRNDSKPVNFGKVYLQTAYGLAMNLTITEEIAQKMLDAFDVAFPGVPVWQNEREAFIRANGYTVTMLGARRHVDLDGTWQDAGKIRGATNFDIQSSAAEQLKLVLAELWRTKFFDRYDAQFYFVVHDEIDVGVSLADLPAATKELHEVMTRQYANMSVPVMSSIEIGPNFGQLIEVGEIYDEQKVIEAGRAAFERRSNIKEA